MCKDIINIFFVKILLIFALVARYNDCEAQDVEFSQYWAAPLHMNPAMTGISYGPRVALGYRNQWPELGDGFNGGFTTYMAAVDGFIPKIKSGIGLLYTGDYIYNNTLFSNKLTASYAFQIKFSRKLGLRIGIEGSFIHRGIKWNNLTFTDMIDPYTGFYNNIDVPNPTGEQMPDRTQSFSGDAGAGVLLFNNVFYAGFSIRNLVRAKTSFFKSANTSGMPFRMSGQLGANFKIKHKNQHRYNIFVSPNVMISNQGKAIQANAGVMGGVSLFYAGLWFRYAYNNPDAVIALIGIKKGKFRVGYSYDITISKLIGRTGGAHELSFIFNWSGTDDNSLNPNAGSAYIECPEILNF